MVSIPTRREMTAWMLALVLALSTVALLRGTIADAGVVAGPTTEVVYIATGENFPDALAASATASLGLGPVLLVRINAVPQPTLDELNRLQPPLIVIMGETEAVSAAVEAQLKALAFGPDVIRIGGANRYNTAADLSAAVYPTSGLYPRAGGAGDTTAAPGTGSAADVLTTTIEAPAAGVLIIQGNVGFTRTDQVAASEDVVCALGIGDTGIATTARTVTSGGVETNGICSTLVTLPVDGGVHTLRLVVTADPEVNLENRTLSVLWVPFDGFGAIPTP
jgi:hypothetical protein